ncbi:MAG: FHA domain-containing protein [Tissierellaceae bacterium]|nr:FHA domain-containing protein [Tissierellaceae bacterium]
MFNVLSLLFKYIFIIIIYMFIFSIIRLIYLDIKGMDIVGTGDYAYLKLINRKDSLPFKINEHYSIDEVLSLGRRGSNDIIIKDPYVSKTHFQVVKDENNYFLEDLDSANGTYLNNERVEDAVELTNGDIIKVGNIEFLFVNKG